MARATSFVFSLFHCVLLTGTAAGAAAAANDTDCFQVGFDWNGGDLFHEKKDQTAEECQALCAATPGCMFFAWASKDVLTEPTDTCYLKDTVVGVVPKTGIISGPKYCSDTGPGLCGGALRPFQCWSSVGSCENPLADMDECREISFSRSRSDSRGVGSPTRSYICVGAFIAPRIAVLSPTGAAMSATIELSSEVCEEWSSEESGEETQLVKVPGIKGKTIVACAKGMSATIDGLDFGSYRSREFTFCENQCPGPPCLVEPQDIGKMVGVDKCATMSSFLASFFVILILIEALM